MLKTISQPPIFEFLEGKEEIREKLNKKQKIEVSGLFDSAFAFQFFGFLENPKKNQEKEIATKIAPTTEFTPPSKSSQAQEKAYFTPPIFLFFQNEKEAEKIFYALKFWQVIFGFNNLTFNFGLSSKNLYQLISRDNNIIYVFSFESALHPLPSPFQFQSSILLLEQKQKISQEKIVKNLLNLGYEEERKTFFWGNFSRRGGVFDIFSPQNDFPCRLEFFGDQIENIYYFNQKTGEKIKSTNRIQIIPFQLALGKNNLFDYLNFFAKQYQSLNSKFRPFVIYENYEEFLDLPNQQKFQKSINDFTQIKITPFPRPKTDFIFSYHSAPSYQRHFSFLLNEIKSYQKEKWQILIASQHKNELEKLFLNKERIYFLPQVPKETFFAFGFKNPKTKLLFLTDGEIFRQETKIKIPQKSSRFFLSELKPNDYVVHLDHGIGKFAGTIKKETDGVMREFFVLEYAEGDKLYLPVEYADKITKYVGKTHPTIYRLHGTNWNNIKQKVKKETKELAKELLYLYAKREISSGFIFSPDTPSQKELEDSFEYEETPDQILAMQEIKKDMEGKQIPTSFFPFERNLAKKPMDRLVCGDVGFGKTELAVRAAYKATCDKKQVALLCPTTILAQQHFETFSKRLKKFPVKIEVLSRFKTKRQQKEILKKLARGEIDIIIGTHRLLSSDVKFYDLGLLILDEEQRFGVKQKEKLKKLKENVDVLTLSATPIPRTLHLALSGLRDISLLTTPPSGRLPVETFILPYDEKIICQAIKQEIKRKGQVYFVHNRVKTIFMVFEKLKKLLPNVRFAIAHGQMKEKDLAKIMSDFYHKKFDVLISSSIIENGLDLANVNTLIVDEATKFGLADLYQLRGRIGRSTKKAYAYFFYHSKKLQKKAEKRLQALLEAKELGSGFQIAQKDLEIRGAGNLLGEKQSGNIEAVGLSLYCQLLSQAIEELKSGKKPEEEIDVTIDLPLPAYLPKNFIPNEEKRLFLYQTMANFSEISELENFKKTFFQKYSRQTKAKTNSHKIHTHLPQEVLNLFEILELKILAKKAKIYQIDTQTITMPYSKNFYRIILKSKNQFSAQNLARLLQNSDLSQYDHHISDFEIVIKIKKEGANFIEWLKKLKNYLKLLSQK